MKLITIISRITSEGFKQKVGIMVASTSAGLFGNLGANQSKLNTRRGKSFLWRDAVRRMKGKALQVRGEHTPGSKLKELRVQLKTEAAAERQKHALILINSILIVALTLAIIA